MLPFYYRFKCPLRNMWAWKIFNDTTLLTRYKIDWKFISTTTCLLFCSKLFKTYLIFFLKTTAVCEEKIREEIKHFNCSLTQIRFYSSSFNRKWRTCACSVFFYLEYVRFYSSICFYFKRMCWDGIFACMVINLSNTYVYELKLGQKIFWKYHNINNVRVEFSKVWISSGP